MAIVAVDMEGAIAPFSCAQMDHVGLIDVSAPGVDILSTYPGGEYAEMSGTSMATPHVAGVAALYLQANSSMTAHQLRHRLEQMAAPARAVSDFGRGIVQAP